MAYKTMGSVSLSTAASQAPADSINSHKKIKGLDGLRAIAFLAVFFYHIGMFPIGWMGVQLFFVLSGFLITPILIDLKNYQPNNYYRHFIFRRSFRIFPIFYFYLLVCTLVSWFFLYYTDLYPAGNALFLKQLPYAMTYTFNFIATAHDFKALQSLEHLWSLCVEEQFYLVWPFLILFTSDNRIKNMLLMIIILSPVLRFFGYNYFSEYYSSHGFTGSGLGEKTNHAIYVSTWCQFDAFAFGALASQIRVPRARTQLVILLFALCPALVALVYFAGLKVIATHQAIWGFTVLNYMLMLITYMVAKDGRMPVLENRWLKRIGLISYGAYVYHFPIIMLITLCLKEAGFGKVVPYYVFLPASI